MSGSSARRADVEALVADYRADLIAAGMFADNPVTSVARMFFTRVGVEGWARLSLADQCALPLKDRRVVGWLIMTGRGPTEPGLPGRLPSLPRRGRRASPPGLP